MALNPSGVHDTQGVVGSSPARPTRESPGQDAFTAPCADFTDNVDHYTNADRVESGVCWHKVSRGPGYRVDIPTDCPEPVRWIGRAMIRCKQMRLWSCDQHVEGLGELSAVQPA